MKNFFAVLLVTWCLAASVANAYGYPRFWKGDTNYPLVWGHQGIAWYLDKNSVKIKLNAPPYYIIAAQTVLIYPSDYSPGNELYSNDKDPRSPNDFNSYEFFYDEDEMDMREGNSSKSYWRYLRPQGSNAESGMSMYVGEAVFYVATGRKFYGNYLWKHRSYNGETDYFDPFKDNYYEDLR